MLEADAEPVLGAVEADITPFFASINGYVRIAEQVSLTRLPELMNAYFTACTDAIVEKGGTLDKYVGDAVVAMFGAPVPLPAHALRACVAALTCHARVAELRERLAADANPWPEAARQLRVRVGLHTGTALIGNMGSRTRFSYTMMGDNVNLAARLESVAKQYAVGTLCTDATRAGCEHAAPGHVVFRALGPLVVVARGDPIEIYEPAALRENASDQLLACLAEFEAGVLRMRVRDWTAAIAHFERSARLERHQPGQPGILANPSTVFLASARQSRGVE